MSAGESGRATRLEQSRDLNIRISTCVASQEIRTGMLVEDIVQFASGRRYSLESVATADEWGVTRGKVEWSY